MVINVHVKSHPYTLKMRKKKENIVKSIFIEINRIIFFRDILNEIEDVS